MGKIVISTNISLDGVVQDPDGDEGITQGGWFGPSLGKNAEQWATVLFEEALRTDALCWAGGPTNGLPPGGDRGPVTGRSG